MKKVLLALLAGFFMTCVFTSCEDLDDPTVYCWEVSYTMDLMGATIMDTIDYPMTNKEKHDLEQEGVIGIEGVQMEITKIKKQDPEECSVDFD